MINGDKGLSYWHKMSLQAYAKSKFPGWPILLDQAELFGQKFTNAQIFMKVIG